MPFKAPQQRNKIPVTIITGFLGAGKTTLLNHLLKERGNTHIAVVENEFGEVNIDQQLVADNLLEKEDLISLENGCMCCSLRKDIVKAFATIETRAKSREAPYDAIIMETTGLADPAPVAFTFFANPWVASRFKLDSIICVVDCRYLLRHLDDERSEDAINEALQQIAFSDLILLNKCDLVNEEEKATVLRTVRKINMTARVIEVQLNDPTKRPKFDQLLGINSFSIDRALEIDPEFLHSDSSSSDDDGGSGLRQGEAPDPGDTANNHASAESPEPAVASTAGARAGEAGTAAAEAGAAPAAAAGAASDMAAVEDGAARAPMAGAEGGEAGGSGSSKRRRDQCEAHGSGGGASSGVDSDDHEKGAKAPRRNRKKLHDLSNVSSVGITARGPLDEYRFNMFMRDLLAEKASDIFRCKGVLSIHGYDDQKFVFQGVHETICYGPCDKGWVEGEAPQNQIVFIGKGLDRKGLIEGFRTCVWVPLPEGWSEFKDAKTGKSYYCNAMSGEKTWVRPNDASAYVVGSHASTAQPKKRLPRESITSM
ncbi:hypothetical protein FOA52_004850 [Chlamydomonas sp. UWO 241]|nr:hypothetical protein FOA52_004850 [Chlamydomonas sp. UWO 241]